MQKITLKNILPTLCKIFSVFAFFYIWYLLVRFNVMKPLMFGNLPSPLEVLAEIKILSTQTIFYQHIAYSCLRIFIGCLVAFLLAVLFGVIIGLSKLGEYLMLPIFDLLRPIPQITWIPISILLFPSIEGSINFITFMGAFFPILVNTIAGIRMTNPTLIQATVSMNASKWQQIIYVYLPSAVPHIFTGLSIGIGTSWMSLIAAEMISGKYGIGYFTWMSYNMMNYPDTIIGMITIGMIGVICFVILNQVSSRVLKYNGK